MILRYSLCCHEHLNDRFHQQLIFLQVKRLYKIIDSHYINMGCFVSLPDQPIAVKSHATDSALTPQLHSPEKKPEIPPTIRRAPKLVWRETVQEIYSQVEPIQFPASRDALENPEMSRKVSQKATVDQDMRNLVRQFFDKYDQGHKGSLSFEEFCQFCKDLALQFNDQQLQTFMKGTDSSGDDVIDQEQLALMLRSMLKL